MILQQVGVALDLLVLGRLEQPDVVLLVKVEQFDVRLCGRGRQPAVVRGDESLLTEGVADVEVDERDALLGILVEMRDVHRTRDYDVEGVRLHALIEDDRALVQAEMLQTFADLALEELVFETFEEAEVGVLH